MIQHKGLKVQKSWLVYIFAFEGSIWSAVLPYCILNCISVLVLATLQNEQDITISFSPEGYGLMTFLITFLIVEKVNLALERYMSLRDSLGRAFISIRELNQLIIVFTERSRLISKSKVESKHWSLSVRRKIDDVLVTTVDIMKDYNKMTTLAYRDSDEKCSVDCYCMGFGCFVNSDKTIQDKMLEVNSYDPMVRVQVLRKHLYTNFGLGLYGDDPLEILEKMKILEMCNRYVVAYTELMKFQSTPIPFPLLQMGRTILLIYTFTMPLALIGFVSDFSLSAVLMFIFFLTYGYVGLELVAFRLMTPFGTKASDLDIVGMRKATMYGIESDWKIHHGEENIKLYDYSSRGEEVEMSSYFQFSR